MKWHQNKLSEIKKYFSGIDRRIWISKAYYASFYVGIGALFPYLPVYFKQLNLSSHQNGILIGIRPLIQFLTTPLWGACADKFRRSKSIFLMSVLGWLVSNFLLCLVPVSTDTELCNFQSENFADEIPLLETSNTKLKILNKSTAIQRPHQFNNHGELRSLKRKRKWDFFTRISPYLDTTAPFIPISFRDFQDACRKTPVDASDKLTFNSQDHLTIKPHTESIKPSPSQKLPLSDFNSTSDQQPRQDFTGEIPDSEKFISCDSTEFIYLLLVTVLGTVVAAPAKMLADTATLQSLNGESHKYGRVRLWGSLGWGVGGFSVGAAVSSNYKTDHCGELVVDYLPCFYVYAAAMTVAFLCATQFQFDQVPVTEIQQESPAESSADKQGITEGLKVFRSTQFCVVIFIAFFCGSATGFIETFLFWYLHELGGGQLLFSVVNSLNCTAEVCVFFIADKLLRFLGHVNVIYLALFCYSIRFVYFYFVVSPWTVLPAELLQGITTAAFWSSCVSYVGLHPGASNTLQGILNGVYMGLGFSMGGFVGGLLVHLAGMRNSFLLYASSSFLLLLVFVALNKLNIK